MVLHLGLQVGGRARGISMAPNGLCSWWPPLQPREGIQLWFCHMIWALAAMDTPRSNPAAGRWGMLQEEDSHLAGKLPAVKNADHCLIWEFPSPLQAVKPGNEWEAAGVGQAEGTAQREQELARQWPHHREPSRGQLDRHHRGGCVWVVAGPRDITLQIWTKAHQKSASRTHLLA